MVPAFQTCMRRPRSITLGIAVALCSCGTRPTGDAGGAPGADLGANTDGGGGAPGASDDGGGGPRDAGPTCPAPPDPVKAVYDAVDPTRLAQLLQELSGVVPVDIGGNQ